ncbi:Rha family transcriptional regulator [Jeotgalibacillus soli]|uniref:Uncharacterized protein n=1 Tax=Jeotgalibacillus soli TaxID=889306 RepID=A0A0C2R651_9BACL|nr:Rha family transcriptional regulator [Jeotgalibacillus soli]KIL45735.1 hypothetical protein KP78_20840 [Jeotgalibacillus soli]
MSLQVINQNGQLLIDSRDVAEMIDRPHNDLMKTIRGYIKHLTQGNFSLSDFFIESTYKDSTSRLLPCFLLTRKGCEMVANKMTGEKGVLFTAAYVTRFEEMERALTSTAGLSPELQMFKQLFDVVAKKELEDKRRDEEIKALSTNVVQIKETFLQRDDDWRDAINRMMKRAGFIAGGNYSDLRKMSYERLEERAKCNINIRLANLKDRLEEAGATKSKVSKTTKMDVIESDVRLKEIYMTIVKEMSIGSMRA